MDTDGPSVSPPPPGETQGEGDGSANALENGMPPAEDASPADASSARGDGSATGEASDIATANGAADAGGSNSSTSENSPPEKLLTISTNSAIATKVTPIFEKLAEGSFGMLPVEKLGDMLQELELGGDTRLKQELSSTGKKEYTLDEIIDILSAVPSPESQVSPAKSSLAKAPLKRVLTKNRDYMESGNLAVDQTVLTYISKLDEHRKACENSGRYEEARAATERLADLKTAQVDRMRSELMAGQSRELVDVNAVYEDEMVKFYALWEQRLRDYDLSFAQSVDEMKLAHEVAREQYAEQLSQKRPTKPKPSRDYLNQKKIESSLVKVKSYWQASLIQTAAAEMYQAELEQAQMIHDVEMRLKMTKQHAKHQQELEALIQRGQRGRDELLLRRERETEKRNFKFRNITMELQNLHTLEIVHLENFLDGQVLAGKAVPLKNGFRRKREVLFSSQF